MALLVWAPLPLGSNRPWSLGLLAGALWLLVVVRAAFANTSAGAEQWLAWRRGWVCCVLVAAPVTVAFAQLWAHALQGSGALLGTLSTFDTKTFLLRALVCLAAVLLVLAGVRSHQRCRQLLLALLVGGLLQSLFAVLLYSSKARYQFLYFAFAQGQRATGTFPNPDHLAGYLELSLAAGLGLLLAQFGSGTSHTLNWRQRVAQAADFLISSKMLVRLTLVVMVVALVLTRSRMGNGAFFFSMLLVGAMAAATSARLRRPALWVVVSMAVIDVVVIGQWVGLERVVDRMTETAESTAIEAGQPSDFEGTEPVLREESLQQRLRVPALSLPLIWQRPWFGHGGGSYQYAFPDVKPADLPLFWNHAHNDYVELAVDVGLVGLLPLLLLAALTAWRSARMLRDVNSRLMQGVGVSALTALCCMGLHSLVDFNLQIPANAFVFTTLLALVWAVPNRWTDDPDNPRSASRGRRATTSSTRSEWHPPD
jgi:O-antigen ligase